MTTNLLRELATTTHEIAKKQGFWDRTPSYGHMLLSAQGELGECLEAHRKNRWAKVHPNHFETMTEALGDPADAATDVFETKFKNTVEDELADCVLYTLDVIAGYPGLLEPTLDAYEALTGYNPVPPKDFATALYRISQTLALAYPVETKEKPKALLPAPLAEVIFRAENLAVWHHFDLVAHLRLKSAYNRTRPYRHDKTY